MASWLSVGIDGGLHGAVVAITNTLEVFAYFDTPIIDLGAKGKTKNAFLEQEMVSRLEEVVKSALGMPVMVMLEQARPMTKQGVSSTFKTGEGFGLWKGILAGLKLSYEIVPAQTWMKRVVTGVGGDDTKARSVAKCQRLFPALPLTKPKGKVASLDGRADAALLAYYGLVIDNKISEPKRTPVKKAV